MAEIFNITHDGGNLDEYDVTVVDGGDLSVHEDAAMGGSHGLKCVIDDSNLLYGQWNFVDASVEHLRFRFYIDPNGLTMDKADSFYFMEANHSSGYVLDLSFLFTNESEYAVFMYVYEDGGGNTGWIGQNVITDAAHYVEVHVERASSNVASDGRVRLWIDGELKRTESGVDNYDIMDNLDAMLLGPLGSIDATISGTLYLDEFRANDDGSEIGEWVAESEDGISGMGMGMKVVRL